MFRQACFRGTCLFERHLLVYLFDFVFLSISIFSLPRQFMRFFFSKTRLPTHLFLAIQNFHFSDRIFHLKRCIQTYFIRIDIFSPQNTNFPIPNPLLFWLIHYFFCIASIYSQNTKFPIPNSLLFWLIHYFSHIDSSHSQITKFPKTSFSPRQKGHSLSRMPKFTTIYRYRLS